MDWKDEETDEEFEAFLRQFRPTRPRPLPTHRRTVIGLAAAAILLLGVAIPMSVSRKGPASPMNPVNPVNPVNAVRPSNSVSAPSAVLDDRPRMKASTAVPGVAAVPSPSTPRSDELRTGDDLQAVGPLVPQAGVFRVGGNVKAPRKIVDVKPIYPDEARAADVQGVVVLQITISEEGSVIDWSVIRSIPLLDQAAIDAVSQWQFEPTLQNGEPVRVVMNVLINFTRQ